jgi:hypothetical protein
MKLFIALYRELALEEAVSCRKPDYVMKNAVFWNAAPRGWMYQQFGGAYHEDKGSIFFRSVRKVLQESTDLNSKMQFFFFFVTALLRR